MHAALLLLAETEPEGGGVSTWVPVLVALITIVPASLAAWFTWDNRRATQAISAAVNHVAEGEPPLIERVRRLERLQSARHEWHASALKILFAQIGLPLPAPPDESMEVKS